MGEKRENSLRSRQGLPQWHFPVSESSLSEAR